MNTKTDPDYDPCTDPYQLLETAIPYVRKLAECRPESLTATAPMILRLADRMERAVNRHHGFTGEHTGVKT